MARRIVFARNDSFYGEAEERLFVDQWIAIDWKPTVFVDSWTGDMAHQQPSFKVGLPSHSFEDGSPCILQYGVINDPEDISWLRGATHGSYMAGGVMVDEVTDVLARVHQLGLRRDGYKGFEVEVLTGNDARDQITRDKREQVQANLKDYWWLPPLVLGVLWWWW